MSDKAGRHRNPGETHCGKTLGSPKRAVTPPEQTQEGFLEVGNPKDEGSPGREYCEQRPEDKLSEMAGKVGHLGR